jgi:protein TonB
MRVLVVDQDSASNEAIARSLRDLYTVDAVTNKGDCLDLLRSNTFEVIVATERLEDGSGLELLGQIAKRWPSVLRIFAADRQRLKLLKGRLGPFELFQTLTYPIDPDRLIATLNLADAAQDANADTSNIQHVVLSGEPPPEAPEEIEQAAAAPRITRSAVRGGPSHRTRSMPAQRSRGNGAAGIPATRTAAAPSPSLTPEGSRPLRHGRSRGATNKAPPVRFPPLEPSPPLEPPQGSSGGRSGASQTDSFAEAAALARAARSNFESSSEEIDTRRLALMFGGGAAVVLAVVVLGFKLFGSKTEAPRPAAPPPVVRAPQYSQEVVDLVAQTESALKADDFKGARANVDKLRQIAPSHPRLTFFDGLLAQQSDTSKGSGSAAASGRGTAKRAGQSSRRSGSNAAPEEKANVTPATAGSTSAPTLTSPTHTSPTVTSPPVTARTSTPSHADSSSTSATADESSASNTPVLAPETPPGLTRPSTTTPAVSAASAPAPASTPAAASAQPPASVATAEPAPTTASTPSAPSAPSADTAPPAPTHVASTSATRRAPSGEPPPVVREAKLIRRVVPDYPSAAKHDGIEGSVDLEVTISSRGVVEDVSVVNATPPDMFEKSAMAAVRKWKYEPRFEDGLPSEAHIKVHLDFGPGK